MTLAEGSHPAPASRVCQAIQRSAIPPLLPKRLARVLRVGAILVPVLRGAGHSGVPVTAQDLMPGQGSLPLPWQVEPGRRVLSARPLPRRCPPGSTHRSDRRRC